MSAREFEWHDDGHTIVIGQTAEGEDYPEIGPITCPGEEPCQAGYVVCVDAGESCSQGVLIDEDGDETGEDCPACKGTGRAAGKYECWVASGSNDNWDALTDWLPIGERVEPGVYRLVVGPDRFAYFDEYHVYLKLGARIGDAPASASTREDGQR